MKVLAISHSCAAEVNQQLYVELAKMPLTEVELVIPARWKTDYRHDTAAPSVLESVQFPVHRLAVAWPGQISCHFYRDGLDRLLSRCRPDVAFVDEEPWSAAAAQAGSICRKRGIPYVCYTKQNILKRYPPPFRWIEQFVYSSSAGMIALSAEVRAVLLEKGFKKPCPLLAHGCDLSLFFAGDSSNLRRRLGLGDRVVGYLGRLVPEKGLSLLIKAVALLNQRVPNRSVQLLIVGTGPEEAALRDLTKALEAESRVVFAGSVPHLQAGEYLRCMDLFVLPSLTTRRWKEQFGRVIVEALASRVAVVGSDSGEIPSLLSDTGGGLVFQEGDEADLAAKLGRLIADEPLRRQIADRGCRAVRERYTYTAIARQLRSILEDLAQGRGPTSDGPGT